MGIVAGFDGEGSGGGVANVVGEFEKEGSVSVGWEAGGYVGGGLAEGGGEDEKEGGAFPHFLSCVY